MLATTHTRDYAAPGKHLDPELIAALMAPLPGDSPTGDSLRYEGTYDQIAEARRADDERLDQGIWQKEVKRADWGLVARLCGTALETRSKDLQIAAWLTEAWCRLHGFPGLNAGLGLIQGLSATFWAGLYPPLEDPDYRIAPFHWINEKMAGVIQFVPLTEAVDGEGRTFTWADWESANRLQQQRLQHGDSKPGPGPLPAEIHHALRMTRPEVLGAHLDQIAQANATAIEIESFLDTYLASAGPSLRQLRLRLGDIQQWIGEVGEPTAMVAAAGAGLGAVAVASDLAPAGEPGPAAASATAPAATLRALGAPQSRDDAYRQLAEIAAFLQRTEPHSPTPYLIHRAIRWGNLPLDQLLPELVRNEGALGELQQLLNLKK